MPDLVSFFTIDWSVVIAIAKPITFEQGRAFYLNPIAIAQGDVDAPVKVAIVKSPDGIAPAQNATATDEIDTFKRLAPDGLGGTRWALPLEGSTTGLAANADHLQNTLLNAGLWQVVAQAYSDPGGSGVDADLGFCSLLNGSILCQTSLKVGNATGSATPAISSIAFAVSGSGATKRITFDTGGSPTGIRMTATRVA